MDSSRNRAMDEARAEACAACSGCVISEAVPSASIPYEIHVTVDEAEVGPFGSACASLGVKPLFLALQVASGGIVRDVMTSSVHRGDDVSASAEARRIAEGLAAAGYRVARTKIETVPWHPLAPSDANGLSAGPGRYFEAHLAVTCREADRPFLATVAGRLGLHLSRNVLKDVGGGKGVVMATARSSKSTHEEFRAMAERCRDSIVEAGFPVEKLIVEYALWDDREAMDARWIGPQ